MIARLLLASGMLLTVCSHAISEKSGTALEPSESAVAARDVIYFHQSYPVLMRLHIQIDAASFDAPWLQYVASLFRQVDTDRDGRLTREETNSRTGSVCTEIDSILRMRDLWTADEHPFDRAITLPELTQFLIDRQRGPFQRPTDPLPPNDNNNVGDTLFDLLDADENRRLSAAEVAQALQTVHRRDLDDDETLSGSELSSRPRGRFATPARQAADATTGAQFVALVPGTSPASVLARNCGSVRQERPRQFG